MTYATTFSGIGGWELGLDACGWQLRWQCECDRFCRAVLAERFGVPIASDIDKHKLFKFLLRTFGSIESARVDALVGSPPCQPFSFAGKKHGVADARHLYPAFIAAVRILRPRYVLMENVSGLVSNRGAFGQYLGGLAEVGYDIEWHCIPACAVGANHQRDRVWIIAYAHSGKRRIQQILTGGEDASYAGNNGAARTVPDTAQGGARRRGAQREARQPGQLCENVADAWDVPDASGDLRGSSRDERPEAFDRRGTDGRDAEQPGLERRRVQRAIIRANNWAVEPDVGRVADGVPFRVDRLKSLGNAVVPQIPFIIGQAINEAEKEA